MKFLFILSILFSLGASRTPDDASRIPDDISIDNITTEIQEMFKADIGPICKAYISNAVKHCLRENLEGYHRNLNYFHEQCFTQQTRPSLRRIKIEFKIVLKIKAAKHNLNIC